MPFKKIESPLGSAWRAEINGMCETSFRATAALSLDFHTRDGIPSHGTHSCVVCGRRRWRCFDHCKSHVARWYHSEQLLWCFFHQRLAAAVACRRCAATEDLSPPVCSCALYVFCWQIASAAYFSFLLLPTFDCCCFLASSGFVCKSLILPSTTLDAVFDQLEWQKILHAQSRSARAETFQISRRVEAQQSFLALALTPRSAERCPSTLINCLSRVTLHSRRLAAPGPFLCTECQGPTLPLDFHRQDGIPSHGTQTFARSNIPIDS